MKGVLQDRAPSVLYNVEKWDIMEMAYFVAKEKIASMNSIELLLEEYKFIGNIGEKYFDRMYATLNFTILFYGAVLTIMYGVDNVAPANVVFNYFLPIGTYILGLFYAYNSFVITKQGFHMIQLENLIKRYSTLEYKKKSFIGWNIEAKTKKYNGDYILAYGTSLMLFILMPIFDYIMGLKANDYQILGGYSQNKFWDYFFSIMPIIFYLIYIIFLAKIIINIIKMHSEIAKIQVYSNV